MDIWDEAAHSILSIIEVIFVIVTITLNPAVDISYQLDEFQLDTANRVENTSKTAGGKGLNVARVVKQLNEQVGASGFLGGSLGNFIREQLQKGEIDDLFVPIHGETRNCIAVLHDGKQTEILEGGPEILSEEREQFLQEFSEFVKEADIVTISGSLPKGLTSEFYKELICITNRQEKRCLLDTNGELLKDVLSSEQKPYLIKPNEAEFADLFGKDEMTEAHIIDALSSPLFTGIEWVVVTLGDQGAIIKNGDKLYFVKIPSVAVVNAVGSGDSVIAGFSVGMKRGLTGTELISYGLTMGILNAMEEKTGQINPMKIEEIQKKIRVEEIDS